MVHELKVQPRYWPDYKSGNKTFSMRKADRHFSVGDIVIFRLWENETIIAMEYVVRKISHIMHDYDFKYVPNGFCILSLKEI